MRMMTAHRTARGYTLFELVVTIAVTGAMLTGALAWVSNLVLTSASTVDGAATDRTTSSVAGALDADFADPVTCPVTGTPVRTATLDSVALFTHDPDDPDQVVLVTWTLANQTLTRSAVPAQVSATDCGPSDPTLDPASAPATTYATDVTSQDAPRDGAIGAFSTHTPVGATSVYVSLTFAPPTPDNAPVTVTRTYPLTASYTSLS